MAGSAIRQQYGGVYWRGVAAVQPTAAAATPQLLESNAGAVDSDRDGVAQLPPVGPLRRRCDVLPHWSGSELLVAPTVLLPP